MERYCQNHRTRALVYLYVPSIRHSGAAYDPLAHFYQEEMDEGEGFNAPLACDHREEWTKLTSLRSLCEGHIQDMDAVEEK